MDGMNPMDRTDDVHALFECAVADLDVMPDAVPAAVRAGLRHRHRRRMAVASGGLAVAAAVPAALAAVPGPVGRALPGVERLTPGGQARADQRELRQRIAATLEELLPDQLGRVRPKGSHLGAYRAEGSNRQFAITFTVERRAGRDSPAARSCAPASSHSPFVSCVAGALPDGTTVTAGHERDMRAPAAGVPISFFGYRDVDVMLALFGDDDLPDAVPITDQELLAVVTDPRFVALVDELRSSPDLLPQPDVGTPTPAMPTTAAVP